ncbi:SAM-dependent methyltransferase [Nonomuraea sp. NN258]|uniref:SAM-dependent methyltransferase n=1 Tax=Nonomuraea antri TaxID=2730852 RepID=UPI00156A0951|nr:SAM-dependent methyltransferase [Nonomuraea antri]NRQ34694.1 SAM-dependent methyltransferase [Nonomuraea antri]
MSDELAPEGIDTTRPSAARIYDYFLGGTDNFACDRQAAERIIALGEEEGFDVRRIIAANRAFLGRVVRELAEAGVRQFLDLGAGLPTGENVHQIVRGVAPESKVVYVDNDPIVLVHARALLAGDERAIVVEGDLREPHRILGDPAIRAQLDFSRPVAILVLALFHFFADDEEVAGMIAPLREALPSGGYLAISHGYSPHAPQDKMEESRTIYRKTSAGDIVHRRPEVIAGFMRGFELLEPGIVPVEMWRPRAGEDAGDPDHSGYLGVVGRLP